MSAAPQISLISAPTESDFNATLDYGFAVRKDAVENPSTAEGGMAAWQKMKAKYSTADIGKWSDASLALYDDFKTKLQIIEHEADVQLPAPEARHAVWEKHHFFFQHGRIPHETPNGANTLKLMQIAFNAGQMKYELSKGCDVYTTERMKYYNDAKLDKMDTYWKKQ